VTVSCWSWCTPAWAVVTTTAELDALVGLMPFAAELGLVRVEVRAVRATGQE
jgi:hypothetical protein